MFEHPDTLEIALVELATSNVGHEALCLVANAEVASRQSDGADGPVLRSVWRDRIAAPCESSGGDWLVTSGHALQPAMQAGAYRVDILKQMLGAWMPIGHVEAVAKRLAEGWLLLCVTLKEELHERAVPAILLRHAAASVQVHEYS